MASGGPRLSVEGPMSAHVTRSLEAKRKKLNTLSDSQRPNLYVELQDRVAQIVAAWQRRCEKVEEERENEMPLHCFVLYCFVAKC